MGSFVRVSGEQISSSLVDTTRQYLVGDLKRPQELEHVHDERVEIGLTVYEAATGELPHRHSDATEYQYVISGWTQYLDTDTWETHEFRRGDFYAILPGTSYAQKSKAGTKILFIKVPSIDDKHVLDAAPRVREWMETALETVRKDHWHDADAPSANAIRPAVSVAIFDPAGRLLMLRRADSGYWTLPGGTLEMDESLSDCATREVFEETGILVEISDIVGTYTDPDARVAYSDGEVRREFTIVLSGTASQTEVQLDSESTDYRWVELSAVEHVEMVASQRRRIEDVLGFVSSGQRTVA